MSRDRPPLIMRRSLGTLRPDSDAAEKALKSIDEGARVIVEIKRSPRNVGRHKLYWKLLSVAADNLADRVEGHLDAELLHEILKQRLGLGMWAQLPSGDRFFNSDSTAFYNMSEPDFNAYFQRVNAILANWLGVSPNILLDEVSTEA